MSSTGGLPVSSASAATVGAASARTWSMTPKHPDRAVLAEHDDGGTPAVVQLLDHGLGGVSRVVRIVGSEQRRWGADLDEPRGDSGADPPPGLGGKLLQVSEVQAAGAGGVHDRLGQRVLAGVFGGRGQQQQLVIAHGDTWSRYAPGDHARSPRTRDS